MQTIDLEKSIKNFLALGRYLQSLQPLTCENVLAEMLAWYRENRIFGEPLTEDEDMLLLQWGVIRPLEILEPTDLRRIGDEGLKFSSSRFQYLNFTRQVFPNDSDNDVEFDDAAIQMSITLYYDPTTEKENSNSLWIKTPNDLEHVEEKFRSIPFVNMLMTTPASRVEVVVEHCG